MSIADGLFKLNKIVWKYKKDRGLSLRDPLWVMILPIQFMPYWDDLKAMHNVERIGFFHDDQGEVLCLHTEVL